MNRDQLLNEIDNLANKLLDSYEKGILLTLAGAIYSNNTKELAYKCVEHIKEINEDK